MRGSRSFFFRGGGVHARRPEMDNVFFLQLIEGFQWFDYRENYTFQGSRGGLTFSRGEGSNFFQGGGGGVLIIIFKETHITCGFLGGGGVRTPTPPPSGSAHAKLQFRFVLSHVILERRPSPVRVSPYSH